jgi:hypothetical protein
MVKSSYKPLSTYIISGCPIFLQQSPVFFTVESGVGEARGLSWSHPALGRKHRGAHAPWQIKQMIWPPNISNHNGFIKSSKLMGTVLEWRWREREREIEREKEFLKETR